MGEKSTIEFTPAAVRYLAKALTDAADHHADRIIAGLNSATSAVVPVPEPCVQLHGEPWDRVIDDEPTLAFIDDRRALRWVPEALIGEVPAGWHPLLVGPAVKKR